MVVYAQELMPGRIGMISGLFFGLAFGSGGLGAAILGTIADNTSLQFIFELCSVLPAIGLLAFYLPNTQQLKSKA
jgi:FSR family fosmidomycin resistance protein-like MFS transporter